MDHPVDPFADADVDFGSDFKTVDDTGLFREVESLLKQHHPANVLAVLLDIAVRTIQSVDDKILLKQLEWEYMHAYRFWSADQRGSLDARDRSRALAPLLPRGRDGSAP